MLTWFRSVVGITFVCAISAIALSVGAARAAAADAPGAVYALTNSTSGNSVIAYSRGADGSLTPAGSYATGGTGTGAGLGSQGAIIVSDDHRFLFAVNAGSNSVSSFRIRPHGLELLDAVASGGMVPVSVTARAGLLYVLNANNVTGFTVSPMGKLKSIDGADRPLSGLSTGPAQIEFSSDGTTLIVTEKATNLIDTYTVGDGGLLTGPYIHASAGPVPFGFAINQRDALLVSEAGSGASSYRVRADGQLTTVSAMIVTGQRAACWAVMTNNGRYGYVTNAGTGNISGFSIDEDGSAALLDASGVTAVTGGNPQDMALSRDSQFLYARVPSLNQISVFRIHASGSLAPLAPLSGTPSGLAGLAGF